MGSIYCHITLARDSISVLSKGLWWVVFIATSNLVEDFISVLRKGLRWHVFIATQPWLEILYLY